MTERKEEPVPQLFGEPGTVLRGKGFRRDELTGSVDLQAVSGNVEDGK